MVINTNKNPIANYLSSYHVITELQSCKDRKSIKYLTRENLNDIVPTASLTQPPPPVKKKTRSLAEFVMEFRPQADYIQYPDPF